MTTKRHTIHLYLLILVALMFKSCADEEPYPAPKIYVVSTDIDINIKDTLIIDPKITYDYHSTYEWWLDGEKISEAKKLTIVAEKPEIRLYKFIVKSTTGSDTVNIKVQALNIVSFEEFALKGDTAFYGQNGTTYFESKGLQFPTQYNGSEAQWTGFAVSNSTIKTSTNIKNRYSSFTGSGVDKSKHYAVYHQATGDQFMELTFLEGQNKTIKSIEINNTTYLYYVIKAGLDVPVKFGEGRTDWYILTVYGYDANGQLTGSVPLYLADYRDNNKTKRYMIEKWTTLNLESLGKINRLRFVLTSSDVNESGTMITPAYFCLDNIKIAD